jgi:hypothetical protein
MLAGALPSGARAARFRITIYLSSYENEVFKHLLVQIFSLISLV